MSTTESTLELLRERFPKCFLRYPQPRLPLKIGIHKDVYAALAGVASRRALSRALAAYVADSAYCEQLKPGTVRIDLSGEPAGVVTPEQVPPPSKPKPPPKSKPRAPHGSHSPAPSAASPKRLSLADLKAAAAARRAGQSAPAPSPAPTARKLSAS